MPLQNHPGDVEFPVRPRLRYARAADAHRRGQGAGRRALLVTAFAAPVGLVGFAWGLALGGGESVVAFTAFAFALAFGLLAATVGFQQWDARAPRREQLAYLGAADSPTPSLRQQQLLALDAVSDFSFAGWNSSLAFQPSWAELPEELRRRYADGAKGAPWQQLPLHPLVEHRVALDRDFRIASADDVELLVADVLTRGPLSTRFAEVSASADAERMRSRVAALTGGSEFHLLELAQAVDGRPPLLLLAGDAERTIGAIRYAYVAGYLPAARAWELLAAVGDRVFERYSGWDAYWADAALAIAFRTDSLGAVQHHHRLRAELAASGWPAAAVPYPG
ncbi:hypothetical protein C5C36_02755 [Rathayibacter sp. AY1G1]|uniref:DUF1266 domain-containing protein n=1 Tax=unclassified Rathayibacter TaxID=2609250 RepID=UPI000CE8AEC3|nr:MULTISPECIES: DUF1266 domain-containing protein [unclassified Rathayibacter]PPF28354.1 hypothetical protein C5C54_06470 [Rathayibacter sp. AY1F2]PPG17886.1 hypothetical protein C5C74_09595 [Rathayibacter sp. AY1E8]PPG48938.1 hypothetical protein C5C41_16300 [Rathayibacter sp. AY1E9]PPG57438.1 hypothetical protein C5C57_12550 [Rathayibacter sp. AY1C5]PPH05235.1 hypothetical protein C5C44_03875 [Rathayibacter sp. AY1F6]